MYGFRGDVMASSDRRIAGKGESMGNTSFWHYLILLFFLLVYVIPVAMIVKKAGYSAWWCLVAFVPLLNIIMLWVFAFASWPNVREPQSQDVGRRAI